MQMRETADGDFCKQSAARVDSVCESNELKQKTGRKSLPEARRDARVSVCTLNLSDYTDRLIILLSFTANPQT